MLFVLPRAQWEHYADGEKICKPLWGMVLKHCLLKNTIIYLSDFNMKIFGMTQLVSL